MSDPSRNVLALPNFTGRAACAEIGGDDWFPEPGATATIPALKRICGRCEIRTECLLWALERREAHGVWGGLTWNERKRILGRAVSGWAA